MRLNLKRITAILFGVALLAAAPLLAAPQPAVSGMPSAHVVLEPSVRASTLLGEIQEETGRLQLDTESLRTFQRSPEFSWQSHAFYLERVKGHVNAVGDRLSELQQIRGVALPWQQKAIDHVTVHALHIASSTEAALLHLNEGQNRLLEPEYRQHLRTIASRSDNMKQTVDKFLNYEKARNNYDNSRQRFLELQNELELR